MIKKVFKTIFILSICLGISLPTNAAVSVSDGSAFITKSELTADLNNIVNRMAQLENSLDAKIDSLVSSYLTRNGIWNGAKQTMRNDSGLSIRYGFVTGSSFTSRWVFNFADSLATKDDMFYENITMVSVATTPANTTYAFIDQISKSGLFFCSTSVSNHRTNDNRCYLCSAPGKDYIASDHFKFIYLFNVFFLVNGNEAAKVSASFIGGASGIFLDAPRLASGSMSFFVAKDDVVTVKTDTTFNAGDGTAWSCLDAWLTGNGYATYDYNINDAYVY